MSMRTDWWPLVWFMLGLLIGTVFTRLELSAAKEAGWRCVQWDVFGQCTTRVFNKPTDDGARR